MLSPCPEDKNRKAELERKKKEPESFGKVTDLNRPKDWTPGGLKTKKVAKEQEEAAKAKEAEEAAIKKAEEEAAEAVKKDAEATAARHKKAAAKSVKKEATPTKPATSKE